ncbi:hypothetical protein AAFN60_16720 [Roseibacillus persicicus]|uniref:hypothetical protein n=1 Tax=Roseibacillus persicicus TaxID=454148 RepID=UPI00398B4A9F
MKPLPLLIALCGLALVGGIILVQTRPTPPEQAMDSAPQAPLPSNFEELDEPLPPIPRPPLLEEDLVPDPQLVTLVEEHLGMNFTESPVFEPVDAETIIKVVSEGVTTTLSSEGKDTLNTICQRIGALPSFQPLDQTVITILAGEVRGVITPTRNLIMHDFQSSSPPEQAALVNLLAQRLLSQRFPAPASSTSVDQILARHFAVQTLALSVEKEFRKTLPAYPPSLNENIRESILLGLPAFFHELSTFGEFHLLDQLTGTKVAEAYSAVRSESSTPSRALLAFPFTQPVSEGPSDLGAIPLYLLLLEGSDPTSARTLSKNLVGDEARLAEGALTWTLRFSSEQSPPRVAEALRSYFSLRDPERKVSIEVRGEEIILVVRP